jgi:hypothetical protein
VSDGELLLAYPSPWDEVYLANERRRFVSIADNVILTK